ncbi:MAG: DEAD/DEAH box helicase [Prevotella sp.]|nr:DEAD/DEAH box helicase [Prevotella sp.]
MKTFEELGVSEQIRRAISELGFEQPMPVQEAVIPYLLEAEGANYNEDEDKPEGDLIALAQTGTGKTAAFGIPLLQRLEFADDNSRGDNRPQALILSPTRELCLQISDDLKDFSKYLPSVHVVAVYGGTSVTQQIRSLKRGAQIVVATPGRLIDLVNRGAADLSNIKNVVLDEADEMLNMGFSESINEIFEHLPDERNTLMFSATMSREIERIAKTYLHNHREIVIGSRNEGAEHVNHIYYLVNAKDKYLALKRIVDFHPRIFAIIFCRTKLETQEIADKLIKDGYNAEALHGDLSQDQRDLTMQKFRQHTVQLLVATDVAARGLDVDDLTHVINYGLPDDIENYTHRSGRTGRAGKKGTSISIIHTREKHKVRLIEKEIGKEFVDGTLPSPREICTKQLYRAMDKIEKVDVDEEQIAPFMEEINRHFEYFEKEDIIKKIVSMTFGRFLSYYADAPEIEKPSTKKGERGSERGDRKGEKKGERGQRKVEKGYTRLFINLGKADGFYPGEVMQMLNRNLGGRLQVGHIDLFSKFSYFEVPKQDAQRVMKALTGTIYKGREVRCNAADETPQKDGGSGRKTSKAAPKNARQKPQRTTKKRDSIESFSNESGDWRELMKPKKWSLRGEEPDFSEDGWAMRKPRKK